MGFPELEALPAWSDASDVVESEDGKKVRRSNNETAAALNTLWVVDESTLLDYQARAEAFASVVNCMVTEIVDLASSSVGGKKEKGDPSAVIKAIDVVLDFMDDAAVLFEQFVQGGTVIDPVIYAGSKVGRSTLEKMYAAYASSAATGGLMGGGPPSDRVDTLRHVFGIPEKKAEGIVQKAMLKNMMSMMKNGVKGMEGMEGMEGLAEMLSGKGMGADGMPDLGDMDGEITPEMLKDSVKMMKQLFESGSISKEDMDVARTQFKDMAGADIEDLIKQAEDDDADLGDDEKELLDLFKKNIL